LRPPRTSTNGYRLRAYKRRSVISAYELRERAGKRNGRDRALYRQESQEMQKATEQAFPEQPR
jgi:hypothetical protein